MRNRLSSLAFPLLLIIIAWVPQISQAQPVAQSSDNDWPMYQHDAAHAGRTPATISNDDPLYLQWAYAFGERVEIEAQPIIAAGVIYQGVMNGEMHAIDADTGAALWIAQPGGPIPHTAAAYGERVYFGSLDGNVYALSTTDGSISWKFSTGGPVMSAPAVVDGRLYIGSNDGHLYALDAATGSKLWSVPTGGPVVSSPAVVQGKVYFGSEDLTARCVNAVTGALIWDTPLYGAGMHNTHPVVSDDGDVVIFLTVKGGGSSYVHNEGYPNALNSANPVETWNAYYQAFPTHRYLYYLDTDTGDDLWNPSTLRYVPLPIPYWGLLHPILAPDGSALFPAPAGTADNMFELDHDNRLFQVDLTSGETSQIAGGPSLPDFQLMMSETGRHVFSGNDYYYTISEDLGVYRPLHGTMNTLFSNPPGYSFGTHMNPHSPLPSRHLWRYGGAVAIGGVPGASPPIIANDMIYFTSYSWLYAVGRTNRGYDPATSFPSRDAREHELTYPRSQTLTFAQASDEIAQRVADIIALGPSAPPMTARWEQCWNWMNSNEFSFELYGFEADLVRALSQAYPHLATAQQTQLKNYLSTFVSNTLLDSDHYERQTRCIIFAQPGIYDENDCNATGVVASKWSDSNPNLVGMRLYALWAYADATGDWDAIQNHWSLITGQFQRFLDAYDNDLGFCDFEEWRVKRLNIGAQIIAAQAVRDMAAHLGQTSTQSQAAALLADLLDTRIALADFVPHLYDTGQREPAEIRLNPDGTINNDDIMANSPYNNELIPYSAALRNRETDPSQVNWWDGSSYRVDAGTGFMHYPALSGYFPLSSEMIARLRTDLLDETRYYIKSYEVNSPWWWMSDLAHHTTGSGEHLYHSPTLAWTMFQVKARVLQQDWNTLAYQLPEPVSFNHRYDLYRLQNLVALVESARPDLSHSDKTVSPVNPTQGQTVAYTVVIQNIGAPFDDTIRMTDTIPPELAYVPGTLTASQGLPDDSAAPTLYWTGALTSTSIVTITYDATVTADSVRLSTNIARVEAGSGGSLELDAKTFVNGWVLYLPLLIKSSGSGTVSLGPSPYLINAPRFDGDVPFAETAVFWFGQVTPTTNYADVRVGYNDDQLYLRLGAFDRRLWYDDDSPQDDLTAWDAATLYLDLDGNTGDAPDASTYRFVGQFNWWESRDNYQAAYQGDGSGWQDAAVTFSTSTGWRGDAPNNDNSDDGWAITFRIPFASLGLSAPPAKGTSWGLALSLHDRDDAAGTAIADQQWPESVSLDHPITWGRFVFGLPTYTPPTAPPGGTVTLQHKLDGATVADGAVGGGSECGEGIERWTQWGQNTRAGQPNFNVQNQSDIADWPCYSKTYITFPLDSLPAGQAILSATLTLHHIGGSNPAEANPSLIHILTVAQDWDEATLTWNNAPPAIENVSQAWVPPIYFPGWPGIPRKWDVSRAVAQAYDAGEPLRLVLYESDDSYHSGKYFVSADTGDWNAKGRPMLTILWGQTTRFSPSSPRSKNSR